LAKSKAKFLTSVTTGPVSSSPALDRPVINQKLFFILLAPLEIEDFLMGLIKIFPVSSFFGLIAPKGQTAQQAPQPEHSSLINTGY